MAFVARHEHADAPNAVGLLRLRNHGPRRRATEAGNYLTTVH
jgi:hypothetical protein